MIYTVAHKDWERMQDLIDRQKDGDDVAAKIKNKEKAVARFVAGWLLSSRVLGHEPYSWAYSAFKEKALSLGATENDIRETLEHTSIPEDFFETHETKQCYTGRYGAGFWKFLDSICKQYDLTYEKEHKDYHSWSYITRETHSRDGRCWPIAYEIKVLGGDRSFNFSIVLVTNEGGGMYGYDYNGNRCQLGIIKESLKRNIKKFVDSLN